MLEQTISAGTPEKWRTVTNADTLQGDRANGNQEPVRDSAINVVEQLIPCQGFSAVSADTEGLE
jgi:hypothetical protein